MQNVPFSDFVVVIYRYNVHYIRGVPPPFNCLAAVGRYRQAGISPWLQVVPFVCCNNRFHGRNIQVNVRHMEVIHYNLTV